MPTFAFGKYEVRSARLGDAALAHEWAMADPFHYDPGFGMNPGLGLFWVTHSATRESYLVLKEGRELAFYRIDVSIDKKSARLYMQSLPMDDFATRVSVMRGVMLLVPLIEKALALRGIRTTFLVSRSPRMRDFMRRPGLGYREVPTANPGEVLMMAKIAKAGRVECPVLQPNKFN